jgi:hypothetical protein
VSAPGTAAAKFGAWTVALSFSQPHSQRPQTHPLGMPNTNHKMF